MNETGVAVRIKERENSHENQRRETEGLEHNKYQSIAMGLFAAIGKIFSGPRFQNGINFLCQHRWLMKIDSFCKMFMENAKHFEIISVHLGKIFV